MKYELLLLSPFIFPIVYDVHFNRNVMSYEFPFILGLQNFQAHLLSAPTPSGIKNATVACAEPGSTTLSRLLSSQKELCFDDSI